MRDRFCEYWYSAPSAQLGVRWRGQIQSHVAQPYWDTPPKSLSFRRTPCPSITFSETSFHLINQIFLSSFCFWYGQFLKSLLNVLQYCLCFMLSFFHHKTCGISALLCMYAKSLQSCLTLGHPMYCSPPGSSVQPSPPALEGRLITTGPPGKSLPRHLWSRQVGSSSEPPFSPSYFWASNSYLSFKSQFRDHSIHFDSLVLWALCTTIATDSNELLANAHTHAFFSNHILTHISYLPLD